MCIKKIIYSCNYLEVKLLIHGDFVQSALVVRFRLQDLRLRQNCFLAFFLGRGASVCVGHRVNETRAYVCRHYRLPRQVHRPTHRNVSQHHQQQHYFLPHFFLKIHENLVNFLHLFRHYFQENWKEFDDRSHALTIFTIQFVYFPIFCNFLILSSMYRYV